MVSTHSRPKAAAIWSMAREWGYTVSTHSRPKAAAASTVNVLCELTMFQHTAARRRLHNFEKVIYIIKLFQHTAARRRLLRLVKRQKAFITFQHTAARRRLPLFSSPLALSVIVSTHSRPKAAACKHRIRQDKIGSFNTQPPEGGCKCIWAIIMVSFRFQHTAARRRLQEYDRVTDQAIEVSTHSRPKAAARTYGRVKSVPAVSTHSRPKAAARYWPQISA